MNAAGDNVDQHSEAGASNDCGSDNRLEPSRTVRLQSRLRDGSDVLTLPAHNDCGKLCDPAVNGALPKIPRIVCNIPNGIVPQNSDDPVKVNNNPPVNLACSTSFDRSLGVQFSGLHLNCNNGLEPYLRNNVNCRTVVDKCPLKVNECTDLAGRDVKNNGAKMDCQGNDDDSSSSDTGNEGEDNLSGDECYIYTYKGDQLASLPSSFFRLDAGEEAVGGIEDQDNNEGHQSRSSSPEMDFLEMDFDPGPSCEQDSEENSERGSLPDEVVDFPAIAVVATVPENGAQQEERLRNDLSTVPNVDLAMSLPPENKEEPVPQVTPAVYVPYSRRSETNLGQRTTWDVWGHHCTSGDLCSPGAWNENLGILAAGSSRHQGEGNNKSNLHSALYHCIMAKRLVLNKHDASFCDENELRRLENPSVERTMIWSEREACVKQVTQISTSACGATAVINVLVAMNVSFAMDRVKDGVKTRLRQDKVPVAEYLLSRSVAGANHHDLIRGLEIASENALYARFFAMYPRPDVSLSCWLAYWMKKGAVPIATLNLQRGLAPGSLIPDAWHHQMVFGVGPEGVYLTNPLEFVNETTLWPQLSSPSVLLVRRNDIIERWNQDADLRPLMTQSDVRWKSLNVLGQVVNVVREWTCSPAQSQGRVVTQHVMIPANYTSGITLVVNRESVPYHELRAAPELV